MKKWIFLMMTLMATVGTNAQKSESGVAAHIIAMEKAALDKWGNGNPDGFLDISAPDVVYFDPFVEKRLDGIDQLRALYNSIRGQVHMDRYELLNPKVQAGATMAVLTFNFKGYQKEVVHKWNCTEVYRLEKDGSWKIIQTHWSLMQPKLQ